MAKRVFTLQVIKGLKDLGHNIEDPRVLNAVKKVCDDYVYWGDKDAVGYLVSKASMVLSEGPIVLPELKALTPAEIAATKNPEDETSSLVQDLLKQKVEAARLDRKNKDDACRAQGLPVPSFATLKATWKYNQNCPKIFRIRNYLKEFCDGQLVSLSTSSEKYAKMYTVLRELLGVKDGAILSDFKSQMAACKELYGHLYPWLFQKVTVNGRNSYSGSVSDKLEMLREYDAIVTLATVTHVVDDYSLQDAYYNVHEEDIVVVLTAASRPRAEDYNLEDAKDYSRFCKDLEAYKMGLKGEIWSSEEYFKLVEAPPTNKFAANVLQLFKDAFKGGDVARQDRYVETYLELGLDCSRYPIHSKFDHYRGGMLWGGNHLHPEPIPDWEVKMDMEYVEAMKEWLPTLSEEDRAMFMINQHEEEVSLDEISFGYSLDVRSNGTTRYFESPVEKEVLKKCE